MKTIFLVEDDLFMIRILRRVFNSKEFNIIDANDGETAISMVGEKDFKPNIIILDIMLPKFNGFEVLKKIREIDHLKNIPVVMLTNFTSPQDFKNAESLGAAAYLIKSQFEPSEIVKQIMKFMK